MLDELDNAVFKFDDLCFASECLIAFAIEFHSPLVSVELKNLFESLEYSF